MKKKLFEGAFFSDFRNFKISSYLKSLIKDMQAVCGSSISKGGKICGHWKTPNIQCPLLMLLFWSLLFWFIQGDLNLVFFLNLIKFDQIKKKQKKNGVCLFTAAECFAQKQKQKMSINSNAMTNSKFSLVLL